MFRRLFPFAFEDETSQAGTTTSVPANQQVAARRPERPEPVEMPAPVEPPREVPANPAPQADTRVTARKIMDFEEIYQSAHFKPPKLAYSILKVVEMAGSPHLSGMSPDAKRAALLMALDAAGVQVEDLLQDAMLRQRALNEAEESLQKRQEEFEATKAKENNKIQSELERITAQYLARIQANLDEVARDEEQFREWQKKKQQEAQHIAEAAALCVPQGAAQNSNNNLTIVLERAASQRR